MISNAQQIKQFYRELLEDGKSHTRTELFAYARMCAPQGVIFTDGMLTGALKTLVSDEGKYECVSRGVYQKSTGKEDGRQKPESSVVSEYRRILENALSDMENRVQANPFVMLDMSDSDKAELRRIQKCMDVMRDTLNGISGS